MRRTERSNQVVKSSRQARSDGANANFSGCFVACSWCRRECKCRPRAALCLGAFSIHQQVILHIRPGKLTLIGIAIAVCSNRSAPRAHVCNRETSTSSAPNKVVPKLERRRCPLSLWLTLGAKRAVKRNSNLLTASTTNARAAAGTAFRPQFGARQTTPAYNAREIK